MAENDLTIGMPTPKTGEPSTIASSVLDGSLLPPEMNTSATSDAAKHVNLDGNDGKADVTRKSVTSLASSGASGAGTSVSETVGGGGGADGGNAETRGSGQAPWLSSVAPEANALKVASLRAVFPACTREEVRVFFRVY